MSMASRIAVMNQGHIVQIGAPARGLRARRRTASSPIFSARSICSRAASPRAKDGVATLESAEAGARCSRSRMSADWRPGRAVAVAVRPEKIAARARAPTRLGRTRSPARCAASPIAARPRTIEIELASGKMVRATMPNADARSAQPSRARPDGRLLGWRADAGGGARAMSADRLIPAPFGPTAPRARRRAPMRVAGAVLPRAVPDRARRSASPIRRSAFRPIRRSSPTAAPGESGAITCSS